MTRVICSIMLFCASMTAQSVVGVRTGISRQLSFADSNPDPLTWHNGLSIGLQLDHCISDHLFLSASTEYTFHEFNKYIFRGATIPEIRPVAAIGEGSHVVKFALEGKMTTLGPEVFRLLFITGAVLVSENLGDLDVTFEDMNSGTFVSHIEKKPSWYIAHSLGFGLRSFFSDQFGIEVIARLHSDYSERFDSSVNAGLLYRIK